MWFTGGRETKQESKEEKENTTKRNQSEEEEDGEREREKNQKTRVFFQCDLSNDVIPVIPTAAYDACKF
jgi:TATA-binding protein-associated factor Taf7